jgi:undecaprenyl-diphosphatase
VTGRVQAARGPVLDAVMLAATFLGDAGSLIALTLVGAIGLWAAGDRKAAILCLLTPLSILLNLVLKEVVGRSRPSDELVVVVIPAVGLSYPSGHAMAGAVFYGFWALLAWSTIERTWTRDLLVAALVVVALLVGLSRIYLGVHWLSDVLGGWTAALFLLVLFAEALKRRRREGGEEG